MARRKKMDRLTERAVRASELGMSYGQYMATYHPRNPSGGADLLPEYGYPPRQPQKANKMAAVVRVDPDGAVARYERIADVARDGYSPQNVYNCVRGGQHTHMGREWFRADQYPQKGGK